MSRHERRLVLCLLPGLDGTGRLYHRLSAELSKDFDIRVLDYAGVAFMSYQALADSLLARLPEDRPFAIVAESFAGPLSVVLAASRPVGLVALIIAASFLRDPVMNSGALARLLAFVPARIAPPMPLLEAFLVGRWGDVGLRRELRATLRAADRQQLKNRLSCALRVDVRNEFRLIEVPILYIKAASDRLLRRTVADDFAIHARDMQRIDVEAPHFIFQTMPSWSASTISGFLRDRDLWTG